MTQPSRTTESISRDNAAIREIMHSIRDLTVPDRATVALGLIGHLATLMNRSQMAKLMSELQEEAERVQDVPPSRARDQEQRSAVGAEAASSPDTSRRGARGGDGMHARQAEGTGRPGRDIGRVGQAGRGEFRSGDLL